MKKISSKLLSVILAAFIIFTAAVPSFAADDLLWEHVWNEEHDNGVILFPGSNNSEMNVSWCSETKSEPKVIVDEGIVIGSGAEEFKGYCVAAPDGDYSNKVTITDLEPGKTYSYQCVSEGFMSNVYSFKTDVDPNTFSAVYMTDIHTSHDDANENGIKETAEKFNSTLAEAASRKNISLLLSAGDQASEGYETEYKGYSSALALKSFPVATTIGNHDRKGIAYKTFNNVPNEREDNLVASYIGGDYWFVKGDVLFLVMDSNNASGMDHRAFMKSAIKANPDVKWKVMMAHHDLYSGRIPRRESENELLRMIWGPLCDEFKIDLMLLGHSHYYTVTNVLYNNKTASDYSEMMTNPAGTVFMVSGSITRPRTDEDLGLNEEWVGYANTPDQRIIYNILDFTKDSITVSSYYKGEKDAFNKYSIVKTSNEGGHPDRLIPSFFDAFVRFAGTVYGFFNNIGVYSDLKDDGFDVDFFEVVFNN
ncbi:MAG: metallophosphoesterase [Clostridia bacterium]|nr:metallophosphoesterase [Clostridia bacterium]